MSVIIKGVEIPSGCIRCKFSRYGECLPAGKGILPGIYNTGKRMGFCPIVEIQTPHGRLIDADEITAFMELERNGANVESLGEFPTIIEAEGKEW